MLQTHGRTRLVSRGVVHVVGTEAFTVTATHHTQLYDNASNHHFGLPVV
jgi:hypothetical protein